jgi:integrase
VVVVTAAAPVSVSAPGRANNLRRVYKAAVDAAGADLGHLDLRGPHDLRHTFSTWLEDAGIPARVIDELMGHQATGRAGRHQASAIGAHYRHTTPEMATRVVAAVEERLVIVLTTAEAALDQQPW